MNFNTQQDGYLALSSEECELATSQVFLELVGDMESCWTGEKFIANVRDVSEIANFKYPSELYTILWLFY